MSNADSRSPSTDALDTLGMIHYKPEHRDAIHLAVEAVEAACVLKPGQRIGIVDGKAFPAGTLITNTRNLYSQTSKVPYHGIVDPFLFRDVVKEERFWFIMKPREVRSLRHVWEHPDFPAGE